MSDFTGLRYSETNDDLRLHFSVIYSVWDNNNYRENCFSMLEMHLLKGSLSTLCPFRNTSVCRQKLKAWAQK